ncbi:aldo/keto reductase [Lacticaseibacillus chiayiensis]|uniref:Aldo/keto reductase n=1 Tax=Lacticaseibacillus chiayiensis TaxID=2100821 RepID=A0ABY6H4G4_9LACO|nr:aldo/keto reductase [Lacticaseibacillus chiayiensis]QVI34230.1 aldo/keto reductase [Lacticaseibacillus chiayiensis]RXT55720.1 aldo/keto reductase [Lacticaseibacillus chiayiensis]UYN56008.1 aldo/keto reductase [Lacticaseibacillus chiayiensis]
MKQVRLGGSNWQASSVALGIMRMNVLSPEKAAIVLDSAYNDGINFIDSADIYGQGKSEEVFGEALKQSGVNRDQLYIQSKIGIVVDPDRSHGSLVFGRRYDFSKEHLLGAVDKILERLQIDYLDSVLLHRPDPLMEVDDVAAAFDELQQSGKVRHFGVSNFNPEQIALLQNGIHQHLLIDQVQFSVAHTGMVNAGMHTNMEDDRSIDHDGSLLPYLQRKQMTLQAWSPFQYGMFEGTFIDSPKYKDLNDELQKVADHYHTNKNAIAVAWLLRHPVGVQVILGSMNPEHIKESAAGADITLTRQEWYNIYFAAGNDLP